MFTSIVVSLDLDDTGDRALPAAAWLAKLSGLPVELITVSSPGMPTAIDTYELERRAKIYRLDRFSCLVLHDHDAGAAIIEHMAARPEALLVMGTSAKGPVARHFLGSVSEYVLGHICGPALVAGPRTTTHGSASPTLIVCMGDSDRVDVTVGAIASWVGTFGGRTVLTTVESTGDDTAAALASDRLGQLAGRVAAACRLDHYPRGTPRPRRRHSVGRVRSRRHRRRAARRQRTLDRHPRPPAQCHAEPCSPLDGAGARRPRNADGSDAAPRSGVLTTVARSPFASGDGCAGIRR